MSSFCKAGITTVKDLIDLDKKCYISTDVLSRKIGINSIRIDSNVMKLIIASFKESWRRCINAYFNDDGYQLFEYDPEATLSVLPNYPKLTLASAEKKVFYNYHNVLQTAADNLTERFWNGVFGLNSEPFFS